MRDCEATITTMACEGTIARSTASSIGPWTVRLNGSTGGEASRGATRGSSLPTSSTASRSRVLVLRRFHVGACVPEGSALHRGSEYNRRTGCGKTARPGLYGGCRATGIPTVETTQRITMTLWKINCMEPSYPGMWQRWFKHQCVAVGWYSGWGFTL